MEYSSTRESWGWTSSAGEASCQSMDSKLEIDPDVLELTTLLCTRISMEDVSLTSLTTATEGIHLRVKQVAAASSAISALIAAAEVPIKE